MKPTITSGLRIGTPAVTSRGLGVADMDEIADFIALAIKDFDAHKDEISRRVADLLAKHPLYENL